MPSKIEQASSDAAGAVLTHAPALDDNVPPTPSPTRRLLPTHQLPIIHHSGSLAEVEAGPEIFNDVEGDAGQHLWVSSQHSPVQRRESGSLIKVAEERHDEDQNDGRGMHHEQVSRCMSAQLLIMCCIRIATATHMYPFSYAI